jgi:hypothetical protein
MNHNYLLYLKVILCFVFIAAESAYAGNVMKIVKDGDPPQWDETEHFARGNFHAKKVVSINKNLLKPLSGEVHELWIDDIKLTLTEKNFQTNQIHTEELGSVFMLFPLDRKEGFILLLTKEQLEKLEKLLREKKLSK